MTKLSTWAKHREACTVRSPPGEQIYNDGRLSLWEVNGSDQQVFCQNLCLLSKLFLDHKTLYYDVDPFLFYVLTEYKEDASDAFAGGGHQLIGYFSKVRCSRLLLRVLDEGERASWCIAVRVASRAIFIIPTNNNDPHRRNAPRMTTTSHVS